MAEDYQEPSVYAEYDHAASQRLIVVANRLPVSAYKDKAGRWQLQVPGWDGISHEAVAWQ